MEHIDVIFYINLDKRTDRREHFEKEITNLCDNPTKIRRIAAIHDSNGSIGCAKSHCIAQEAFLANPAWKTCLIFEDDFAFRSNSFAANNQALRDCFTAFPDWDCVNLGVSKWGLSFKDTAVPHVKRVVTLQSASGYALTRAFGPTLLKNFREARDKIIETRNTHIYSIDQWWKRLQPAHQWYMIHPALGYQYPNHSDIEHKAVDYDC